MAVFQQLLLLVVLTLSLLTIKVISKHYYIVPLDLKNHCQKYPNGTCFILDELAPRVNNHDFDNSELIVSFFPGEHSLSLRPSIKNITNVSLNREPVFTGTPTISCNRSTGFEFKNIIALTIDGLDFFQCKQEHAKGGAVFVCDVNLVTLTHCSFTDNHAMGARVGGGAIYFENINAILIERCVFQYNFAVGERGEGGAIVVSCTSSNTSCKIYHSHFNHNQAYNFGGALSLHRDNNYKKIYFNVKVVNTSFSWNLAALHGGAIHILDVSVSVMNSSFMNNHAGINGGALALDRNIDPDREYTFTGTNNQYVLNRAANGGAFHTFVFITVTTSSHYVNNYARQCGGAIYFDGYTVSSSKNTYSNNTAITNGGAVYNSKSLATFNTDIFLNNNAQQGAAIYQLRMELFSDPVEIHGSIFAGNVLKQKGVGIVYFQLARLKITGHTLFTNNSGSLYVFNSPVEFQGTTIFTHNTGEFGGAITVIQSTITFNTDSVTTILDNTANYGGGLSLSESSLLAYGAIEISHNKANVSGGGIYAYQSILQLASHDHIQEQHTNISSNTANQNGGGLYLTAAELKVTSSFIYICNNKQSMEEVCFSSSHQGLTWINGKQNHPLLTTLYLSFVITRLQKGELCMCQIVLMLECCVKELLLTQLQLSYSVFFKLSSFMVLFRLVQ